MILLAVIAAIAVLLALRAHAAFAIGVPALGYFVYSGIPIGVFVQRAFAGVDQYSLVAIPLFILVGALLQAGGLLDDLMRVLVRAVARLRWGLALANVLDSAAFSGVSGSAAADVATLGPISIPLMKRAGYPAPYAAALTAATSIVGPIIPPSIVFIFYGAIAGVSIGDLFLAGVAPGSLLVAAFAIVVFVQRKRFDTAADAELMPPPSAMNWLGCVGIIVIAVFIVGSIGTGLATPTESAGVAAAAALALCAIRSPSTLSQALPTALVSAARLSMDVLLLIAASTALAWVFTVEGAAQAIFAAFASFPQETGLFFLLLVILLLILGLFLDTFPAIILTVPSIAPVASALDIDPLQLGVVVVLSLMIGAAHPPVGVCLYMSSRIAEASIWKSFIEAIPFLLAATVVIVLVCVFPELATFIPRLSE